MFASVGFRRRLAGQQGSCDQSRGFFLDLEVSMRHRTALNGGAAQKVMLILISLGLTLGQSRATLPNLGYLHQVALEVTSAAKVKPGQSIVGTGPNTTGFAFRVPGATLNYYPAFWIRDAAMMLGADLVPKEELDGWIRIVARTQPGPAGMRLPHDMFVPGYSIPDHIAVNGDACWYPGAYADQGVGNYGLLPPADDAFYFVQMVHERYRLGKDSGFLKSMVHTAYGDASIQEVTERAFESIAVDTHSGLVLCDSVRTRVDWGFCDSIRKTGEVLMPSLMRWQAAGRLAELLAVSGDRKGSQRYRLIQRQIRSNLNTFATHLPRGEIVLSSATGVGRQDDIWASAFAVWLGVLPKRDELAVARHLLRMYRTGGIVSAGQIRQLPEGEYWSQASSAPDTYQNGGYWATPTGWFIAAINTASPRDAREIYSSFIADLKDHRNQGAPFEWTVPARNIRTNPQYGSSAGLVYVSLVQAGFKPEG